MLFLADGRFVGELTAPTAGRVAERMTHLEGERDAGHCNRHRPRPQGAFAGAFLALLLATTLVAACGILLETSVRASVPTERYAATSLVVAGSQRLSARC